MIIMSNKRIRAEQASVARRILQRHASSQKGHNNCWYHPEVLEELMRVFGIEYPTDRNLLPRSEFRLRCQEYECEVYEGRQDKL